MTFSEHSSKMRALAENLPDMIDQAFKAGAVNLLSNMKRRIFDVNEDVNGQPLGKYSKKPMLIGAKSFRNTSQANTFFKSDEAFTDDTQGFRTLKNGKKAYLLPGGYSKLRKIQGMQSENITLRYTTELQQNGLETDFSNGYVIRFKNKLSMDKGRGFEKSHNKKVFYATPEERKNTIIDINNLFVKQLNQYL